MTSEAEKFDAVVRKLLSVSHEEIQRRDKEWRRKRAQKKRAKTSPVSRASDSKVITART
jgi:U3 small nucleolar ribonucleoprotein component